MGTREKHPTYRDKDQTYYAYVCEPMGRAAREQRIEMKCLSHGHHYGIKLANGILEGLKVVGYWDVKEEQDWGHKWHRNEGFEIDFQASGRNWFSTVDHDYLLEPNDLVVTYPWQLHQLGIPHVQVGIRQWIIIDVGIHNANSAWKWPSWIILSERDKTRLSGMISNNCNPRYHLSQKHVALWFQLQNAIRLSDGETNLSSVAILINEILFSLIECLDGGQENFVNDSSFLRRIINDFLSELVEDPRLLTRKWTLDQMAQKCGMSESVFCFNFRQLTNSTPMKHLNYLRIMHACRLLKADPGYSITQLAFDCGFSSSQYFATSFKRITGQTPSSWSRE
ncbi:MAG: helix-turn-helix transcriptional regulator [Planctomycetia bacterium]|nr:helix-turn-helix transcriptional regulator [Planctomycetia bacterium]